MVEQRILRFAQNDKIYVILSLQAKDPAVWVTGQNLFGRTVSLKILRFAQNDKIQLRMTSCASG
jgi:hypothetical protein